MAFLKMTSDRTVRAKRDTLATLTVRRPLLYPGVARLWYSSARLFFCDL